MRGDLSETSAADVCRALATSGANGVLDIEGPDGRGAIVWRDGRVIAATSPTPRARLGDRLVGAGLLADEALHEVLHRQASDPGKRRLGALLVDEGLVPYDAVRLVAQEQVLDAVFDVLRWRYGAYRLEPLHDDVIPEIPLRLPVEHLLVEVARRQQEWAELQRVIPDLAAVPSFRPQASADAALEPDEFAVLASIDGVRSVRELAADLGYGEFEAARIVYGLWLLGIVEVSPPEDEIGRALEEALAGFDDLHADREAGHLAHDDDVADRGTSADAAPAAPGAPASQHELATHDPVAADPATADPDAADPDAADPGTTSPAADGPVAPSPAAPGPADADPPAAGTPTPPRSADDRDEVDLEALLERMDAERPDRVHGAAETEATGTDAAATDPATSGTTSDDRGADHGGPVWVDPLPAHPVAGRAAGDDDATAAPPEPASTPAPASTPDPASTKDPAPPPTGEPAPAPAAPPPEDVAELLRELSQLSAGDDEDPAPSPGTSSTPHPPRPTDKDDGKRKRRGLFGR